VGHYYTQRPDVKSDRRELHFSFRGRDFSFMSDRGVFAKDGVDEATAFLLETLEVGNAKNALDLGTGYGVIGIALAVTYGLDVTMTDVNERALYLAEENASHNNVDVRVVKSDGFEALEGEQFDLIVTNPPIRIGKARLHALIKGAKRHLSTEGSLWLVVHKKHGAPSMHRFLEQYYETEEVKKHKGFRVYKATPLKTDA